MSILTTVELEVEALYVGYFQRAGDPIGTQYWENQLQTGAITYLGTAESFSVQLEAQEDYPYFATESLGAAETELGVPTYTNVYNFINQVYQDLFHRSVDPSGLAYWSGQLVANVGNPQATGGFIINVISGAATGGSDDLTLQNTVAVASFITDSAFESGGQSGPVVNPQTSMAAPDTNVSGTTGDIITGSTTNFNKLFGSLGNDTITASKVGGDYIITDGGADTINLNVHTVGDTVELAGYVNGDTAGSISSGDSVQPGFWGAPPSGVPAASTSADQSVVTNFTAGSGAGTDTLQISVRAWLPNLSGYYDIDSLINGNATSLFAGGLSLLYYTGAAVIDAVAPNATLSVTANVIELTGATFANASAVATALASTYNLTFGGGGSIAANTDAHMLFLYSDASGNTHMADVDFENGGTAATTTAAVSHIFASDMVQLTGVSVTSLAANNINFI
jgi:hypothetical protein